MEPKKYSTAELQELARKHLARNYEWAEDLVLLESVNGSFLRDLAGKQCLDMLSCYSALNVGHGHPAVTKAVEEQCRKGLTACPGFLLTDQRVLFAAELAEFCGMEKVLPMNSGGEAVETAMKIARKWAYKVKKVPLEPPRAELIFCRDNFHGRSIAVISASTVFQYRVGFGPFLPKRSIKKITFGNAKALARAITRNTAAFLVEPIQCEGGIIIPPDGYLEEAKEICEKSDVLFVADEVQTGFGRTGHRFACDRENIKPDLYVFAKSLGGGLPISAVCGPASVMDVLGPGDHGSTMGGNPLSCAAARAAMRVIKDEDLTLRSRGLGRYFLERLNSLAKKSPHIREVRGRGLLVGVEVKKGGPSAHDFCVRLREACILTKETREYVLRFSPPLTISRTDLDWGLERIEEVFLTR